MDKSSKEISAVSKSSYEVREVKKQVQLASAVSKSSYEVREVKKQVYLKSQFN